MANESTARALRRTGISVVGDVRWGTHFCHFYETKQDLLETLVPYFKAGLESNEFCLWIVSPLVTVEEAKRALGQAVSDLDHHLAERSLEIHGHEEWYLHKGRCEPQRVHECWCKKLDHGLAAGFAGLRASGDGGWIADEDRMAFWEYEKELDALTADQRMIILCTYPLSTSSGDQVFDLARIHQVAVARRHGSWEIVETPELKQAKAEIKRLNEELEQRVVERTREFAKTNEKLRREITERRRVEEKLKQSERLLAEAQDLAHVGSWSLDLHSYTVTWSDELYRIFGVQPSEFAHSYEALIGTTHPEDRDWLRSVIEDALKTHEPFSFYYRITQPAGEVRVLHARGAVVTDEHGNAIRLHGTAQDVTERKQAEEALNAQALRYKTLMETSTDSIYVLNEAGDLQEANAAFLRRRGYTAAEVKGLNVTDWDAQWSREQLQARRRKLAGSSAVFETRHRCKDGSVFDVEVCVTGVRIAGEQLFFVVTRDISERKQAEERLRRSEEKFKTLFGIAPVGISVLDRQHRITDANPALERITRLSKEELLNGTYRRRTYLNADDTPKPASELPSERAVAENRPINDAETGIVTENGEIIWTQVSVAPLALPDVSAVVITQDITERKRAAKELEEVNHRLRFLSRRLFEVQEEERRHLARELHDEIGQTLTAAKLNLKIIAPDVAPIVAGRLEDSIQLLDRLLQQVRELSLNLRPPLLDELGLVPALRWLVDQQSQRAGLRVTFTANVDGLEIVPAVQTACFRVAQEAITNTIRHAGAKSVAVDLSREAEQLWLSVRDDGAGFDPAAIQQGATQHFSLGLLSMKERALLVRGGLEIRSVPGTGTEIRAWFPLAARAPVVTSLGDS